MRRLLGLVLLVLGGAVFAAEFVPGIAAGDAGKVVDPRISKFSVFYIPAGTAPETVVPDIKKHLTSAAEVNATLGIIGPDYALNARILGGILRESAADSLKGASIVVVNGGEDVEELKTSAVRAGADFRVAKYSGK